MVAAPRSIHVIGDWQVRVEAGSYAIGRSTVRIAHPATISVPRAAIVHVRDEEHDSLPLFDPKAAPWSRGAKLRALTTFETTAPDMLALDSLVVKAGVGPAAPLVLGRDYAAETRWATVGRLPDGIAEGRPVWIDYDCGWNRIDSIVAGKGGQVRLKMGMPHNATPRPPEHLDGETVLANIWVPGRLSALSSANLYLVREPEYIPPRRTTVPAATALLPYTWEKLTHSKPVHILAWGDSVTAGGQASDASHQYQARFVALLHKRFPKADLRLTTVGWGGRTSDNFLNEPEGAQFNFMHAVLEPRPDLIVMEFVNDAWMSPEVVETKYSYLKKRFAEIGAEWVILTPHFVRPDWMGVTSGRVEADPRPYVAGVRQFAARHNIALADASLRWGHLDREGVPYVTLLSNSINHPDDRGHELFAQALMELFR